jgi:uncharacterized NAD(P)/FAD-binding protein YdhS
MKSDRQRPVAIVGGGFSGTMMAAQLARRGIPAVLIEGEGRAGRGTAYSTVEGAHLLNVRAEGMSAWPDDPDHFVRAFEAEGGDRKGFAQRRLFGRYLGGILDEAKASGLVELIEDRAVAARPADDGWTVETERGEEIEASAMVLATGNQPPEPLRVFERAGERFINNPWGPQAATAIAELARTGGDALLVGTGLTMVDTVLSLAEAGHRGRILALSRRGQMPRAHGELTPAPVDESEVPHGNVLALWRWLRRRAGAVGWRAAVDSLRPYSHSLWQALSPAEQRRFIRHARPWWDVHRHRIAPEVAERLRKLIGEGRLQVAAGRIGNVRPVDGGLLVEIRKRGGSRTSDPHPAQPAAGSPSPAKAGEGLFAFVFNCTGPLGTLSRTRDPMLRDLLEDGLVTADALAMGLEVDADSRAGERVWALGPLTKGRFWEIVAVPDIKGQANDVADAIAKELGR